MRKLPLAAALLVASAIATDAYAWGDEGHKVACEIAFSQVKPSTRAAITEDIECIRLRGHPRTLTDHHSITGQDVSAQLDLARQLAQLFATCCA